MKRSEFIQRLSEAFPIQRRSSTDWILPAAVGLGLGVAAGVGIGLLWAPQSGAETRQRLREGAERARDRAREAAGKVRGELASAADEIRERSFSSQEMSHNR
jgi:gas vesicle protein